MQFSLFYNMCNIFCELNDDPIFPTASDLRVCVHQEASILLNLKRTTLLATLSKMYIPYLVVTALLSAKGVLGANSFAGANVRIKHMS